VSVHTLRSMTSVCLLVLLFSEQGETMQCAVWKNEHEHKAKTETDRNRGLGFQTNKTFFFFFWKTEC